MGGSQGSGKVLTSDAAGKASWQIPSITSGNSDTQPNLPQNFSITARVYAADTVRIKICKAGNTAADTVNLFMKIKVIPW